MANDVFIVVTRSGAIEAVTRSIDGAAHAVSALGDDATVEGEPLTIDNLFEAVKGGHGVTTVEFSGEAPPARVEHHAVTV